jgi:hypothetical protein
MHISHRVTREKERDTEGWSEENHGKIKGGEQTWRDTQITWGRKTDNSEDKESLR